jgi:opacity protein-like surface antigen
MKRFRFATLAAALVVLCSAPARAQGFITPFIGYNFGGDSGANCQTLRDCEDKRVNWGVALGTTHGILGFEEEIAYAKDFFGQSSTGDSSVLTVMSNLLVVVPAGPIQPYGLIGLGLIRPHIKFDSSSLDLSQNTLGYSIGGGLNIFLTHGVGLRGDVRHLHTLQDVTLGIFSSQRLDFWRASAGLTFRF